MGAEEAAQTLETSERCLARLALPGDDGGRGELASPEKNAAPSI